MCVDRTLRTDVGLADAPQAERCLVYIVRRKWKRALYIVRHKWKTLR